MLSSLDRQLATVVVVVVEREVLRLTSPTTWREVCTGRKSQTDVGVERKVLSLASPTTWREVCTRSKSQTDVGEAAAHLLTLNTNIGAEVEMMQEFILRLY